MENLLSDILANKKSQKKGNKLLLLIDKTSMSKEAGDVLKEVFNGCKTLNIEIKDANENLFKFADCILSFSPSGKTLVKAMKDGVVPIVFISTGKTNESIQKFKNYNPNTEQGNSFFFYNLNKWEIFTAIVKALETYKFPYDWKNIIRQILKQYE